ncbi:hypothetical protein QZH41_009602 [Actinostola sp. cb2023]|nr:hypothetical protein QZH41_009602 [Actinostola sp. cb2023]
MIRRSMELENHISVIPDSIALFKNLIELDVSSNGIAALSSHIVELVKLKTFVAKNNNMEDLPKEFGRLLKLENLNLSGNRLSSFVPQLFQLINLKGLHLGGNMIRHIPPEIQNLRRLEILYLGGNRLTSIPTEMGYLRKLRALNLCNNMIESLPCTLNKLSSLHSLSLHSNKLTTLPIELVRLKNLDSLSLRDNPLVVRFIRDMVFDPPSLLELTARSIKNNNMKYTTNDLPPVLVKYLDSARRCVNPRCKGVYFDSSVRFVKFVDFCGKYRVPLEQFLCSPHENERWDEMVFSSGSGSGVSSDEDDEFVSQDKLKKVLLG